MADVACLFLPVLPTLLRSFFARHLCNALRARLRLSRDARSAHCVLRQDERSRNQELAANLHCTMWDEISTTPKKYSQSFSKVDSGGARPARVDFRKALTLKKRTAYSHRNARHTTSSAATIHAI